MNKHRPKLMPIHCRSHWCLPLWPLGSCNDRWSDRINCLAFTNRRSDFINFELQVRSDCRQV